MSAYERIAEQLRQAREQIPSSPLAEAADAIERLQHILAELGGDSDELREASEHAAHCVELVEQARACALQTRLKVFTYLRSIGGLGDSPDSSGQTPRNGPPASASPGPEPLTNASGDRYPADAAGLVEQLPKRVTPDTGERTVGVLRVNGRRLPEMQSGVDEVWSSSVRRRFDELKIDADRLPPHVELKYAAMMIDTGQRNAELAINYTPCGVERRRRRPDTCDQVLETFLPSGYTLTVYGTTQGNEPFTRTYRGRGS